MCAHTHTHAHTQRITTFPSSAKHVNFLQMILLDHRTIFNFEHMCDDGKILLVEVSLFHKLTHLKQLHKSDHLDFVTNLRFLFLTSTDKPKEETVNHTLNKTSKTDLAGSDYQHQVHPIYQEESEAWIVNLNRLGEGGGFINLTSQHFFPVCTQQAKEDDRSMFYTQFITEWKIIWNYISEILQPFTLKELSFSFPAPKHRESNAIKDQKEGEMLGCHRPTYQTVT